MLSKVIMCKLHILSIGVTTSNIGYNYSYSNTSNTTRGV